MKTNGTNTSLALLTALAGLVSVANAQNQEIQFTQVNATAEGAIQLYWTSNTNDVYEIQYADELNSNDDGTTLWSPLYTDYPSHGPNTFIGDFGLYDSTPEILHPKYGTQRFYRIFILQTNDSPSNPTVSFTSPTNGAVLSGDVTMSVSASSSEILSEVKVYIDGEEQWTSDDGSNYVINTCEYLNGPHVLFATAKSQSTMEGAANGAQATYGRAVSSYVTVTFSNLITRFDLSEPFFEPSEGQTQIVSAVFAANANWILEIQDVNTNDVLYATGSGATMTYRWDGTGTNGASIPDGIYSYLLTVQTNGLPIPPPDYGDGGNTNPPPVPGGSYATSSSSSDINWFPTSKRQAIAAGWDHWYVQHPPVPRMKTNGTWVSWEDVYGPLPWFEFQVPENELTLSSSSSMTTMDEPTAEYAGQPSQNSRAPKRKPRVGVKNAAGSFGVAYKTYGTNGFTASHPLTGWPFPLPTRVAIDGQTATQQTVDPRIKENDLIANEFAKGMKKGGFKQKFFLRDDQWNGNTVKKGSLGGQSIFNTAQFGLLMTHASFATTAESDNVKYTYCWLLNLKTKASEYLRFSDFNFGAAGTTGLKWMTIQACNILRPDNITSMANAGKLPDNENLHLLMGPSTTSYACPAIGRLYASNLVNGVAIPTAWVNTGLGAFALNHVGVTNTVKYRYYGYINCFSDTVKVYNDPDINQGIDFVEQTVFTYP